MTALYTIQAEHRHKPGRRFYLDRDLCLASDAKSAKALPLWRAWLALVLLRALAWLLADGAPGMTPKIVELAVDAAGARPPHRRRLPPQILTPTPDCATRPPLLRRQSWRP